MADDPFRRTAKQNMRESGAALGGNDNQVGLQICGHIGDFLMGYANLDQRLPDELRVDIFLLTHLLGRDFDPGQEFAGFDGLWIEWVTSVRIAGDRRFDDVEYGDFGAEVFGNGHGVSQCLL